MDPPHPSGRRGRSCRRRRHPAQLSPLGPNAGPGSETCDPSATRMRPIKTRRGAQALERTRNLAHKTGDPRLWRSRGREGGPGAPPLPLPQGKENARGVPAQRPHPAHPASGRRGTGESRGGHGSRAAGVSHRPLRGSGGRPRPAQPLEASAGQECKARGAEPHRFWLRLHGSKLLSPTHPHSAGFGLGGGGGGGAAQPAGPASHAPNGCRGRPDGAAPIGYMCRPSGIPVRDGP